MPASTPRSIKYRQNEPLDPAAVASLFESAGISRPTRDLPRMAKMLAGADLVISAWDGSCLVGVGRSLTDFCYCCYLSDLAVHSDYQRDGIGKELIRQTRAAIGEEVSLVLLSAPGAMNYYPGVGFARADNAYVIRRLR